MAVKDLISKIFLSFEATMRATHLYVRRKIVKRRLEKSKGQTVIIVAGDQKQVWAAEQNTC